MIEEHAITKLRRDPVRRMLRVASKQHITPGMLRIVFQSDQLKGFESPSPDDHIKIFIPQNGDAEPIKRDFTPRAWDLSAGTLTLDFVLHESGPAAEWARGAQAGDQLEVGGPRGSTIVPDDFDWYLLIGDATALPSFARRLESLRSNVVVHVFVFVAGVVERQHFDTETDCRIHWLEWKRSIVEDTSTLRLALKDFALPPGDGFVWIAAETEVSREIYRYLVEERHHPTRWIKASAYWTETRE